MIAYLDTEGFAHVYQKVGSTGTDVANLRKAIYGRALSIRLSLHTLEEILLARKFSPQAFAAQIKLTLSLANSRALVKPCAQLLRDDLRAYAASGRAERPFLRGDLQNTVADGIATLIETDGEELEDDFVAVLEDARRQKKAFAAVLGRACQPALAAAETAYPGSDFEHYFAAAAIPAAEGLAEEAGVAEGCRERGFEGLLEIKSVRLTLGLALASSYERISEESLANSLSPHHAVSAAAAAEIFVSDKAALRELLARVPLDGFQVVSLPEFLKRFV